MRRFRLDWDRRVRSFIRIYDHYLLFCLMRPARRALTRNAQQSNEHVGILIICIYVYIYIYKVRLYACIYVLYNIILF